jgi:hypothetical protein
VIAGIILEQKAMPSGVAFCFTTAHVSIGDSCFVGGFSGRSPKECECIAQQTHLSNIELIQSQCTSWNDVLLPRFNGWNDSRCDSVIPCQRNPLPWRST